MNREQIEEVLSAVAAVHGDETGTLVPLDRVRDAMVSVFEEANTPTDDEREALAARLQRKYEFFKRFSSDGSENEVMILLREAASALHRTVHGEPKHTEGCIDWCNHCQVCGEGIQYGSRCPAHYLSDDAIHDAMEAQQAFMLPMSRGAMRAALRAAAATEGGEHRADNTPNRTIRHEEES
ncbi:hypothetical protein ACIPY5_12180 [Microbacterium sp. NPDC089698]|uniref:hypothetical protein n=1 Tax=Microbacterium sp. NPDC089698 TaxID=3364200 RepID=UPI0037F359E7